LVLDSRNGWARGGDSGPAIIPGSPEKSVLFQAVNYEGRQMPPTGKLDLGSIARLREWIELGAPDPREGPEIGMRAIKAQARPQLASNFPLRLHERVRTAIWLPWTSRLTPSQPARR